MRDFLIVVCLVALLPGLSLGQANEPKSPGQGYFFFAPGGISGNGGTEGLMHFGGGGDGSIYKGIGIGAEIGFLSPWNDLGYGFGLFSINGLYQFLRDGSSQKAIPFVTAGYSLGFRSGTASGFNFGGGLNYWFARRVGLRLEFRDHIFSGLSGHIWQGRIGINLR